MSNRHLDPSVVKVAIFGLGFVGLPLALSYALRGCSVTGVDVDSHLVEQLNSGITHHLEKYHETPIQQILKEQLSSGKFRATTDSAEALANCNYFVMTVGIPVVNNEHDFSHIESCSRTIASGLKKGDLVLVRSTLVPGMTRNFVRPILEESGLKAGKTFTWHIPQNVSPKERPLMNLKTCLPLSADLTMPAVKKPVSLWVLLPKPNFILPVQ